MSVPSFPFIVFALIGAGLFNLASAAWWRQGVLLVLNLAFLLTFSRQPEAFLPFAGFLAFGFLSVRLLQSGLRKLWFLPALIATLLLFFVLKKYAFVPSAMLIDHPYLTVGLSYVFFRVLHLIIDAYQGSISERVGLVDYINYTLNFTCLVSGPIQRFQDSYLAQTRAPLSLDDAAIGQALERIVLGFFKAAIVSAVLLHEQKSEIAALAFAQSWSERMLIGSLIVAIYPIYLYFNFSGYTDTAIGAARLFRIAPPENFNHPFSAANFIDFWNRWHITLSSWLRTYVYNPLLMFLMRRFPSQRWEASFGAFALFVTFFLVGAWHGQTSEFLFFGLLQGGGVAINRLYQVQMTALLGRKGYRALGENPLYRAISRGLTFTWFAFTLMWFWSDWGAIEHLGEAMGTSGIAAAVLSTVAAAAIVLWVAGVAREWIAGRALLSSRYLRTSVATVQLVALAALYVVLGSSTPEIVYKAF